MLKLACRVRDGLSAKSLIQRRVANITIIADNAPIRAEVLSIMAAKTPLTVEMPDVVRVRFPVSFHFGKEIRRVDALQLFDCRSDGIASRIVGISVGYAVV